MIVLSVADIRVSYGATTILQGARLEVQAGEKVALVGPNGAGKSTLLQVLTGELEPESGVRTLQKDTRLGYLAQSALPKSDKTVWEEARSVFAHADALEAKLKRLTEQMAALTAETPESLARDYENTERAFQEAGGYAVDSQVRRVLSGMQFPPALQGLYGHQLSGGQKTRLQLAKLLLQEPEVLLLDEPTNYLDIATVEWLESYLEQYRGGLLIVSHDRYFLDRVTTVTYELRRGQTVRYPGNYSIFAELKAAREQELAVAFDQQQAEIARMEDFIARNIVRASTTKRAQSRRKALEKLERAERPTQQRTATLTLQVDRQSGKDVLRLDKVAVRHGATALFAPLTLQIQRGEHVALLGQNGVGKTSLLKALIGMHAHDGKIRLGTGVDWAYFAQEQEELHPHLTVIEELWRVYPNKTETEIRTRLGQLLFGGEDVFKLVSTLSGGEKSRLALAKLSFTNANLLLLDEPTNHLDLPSKEVLEEALLEYEGTLLFVSHDRYFINRIATRVLDLSADGVIDVEGGYDDLTAYRTTLKETLAGSQEAGRTLSVVEEDRQRRKQQKSAEKQRSDRLAKVEAKIQTLEKRLSELEANLYANETYEHPELAAAVQKQHTAVKAELDPLYEEWAELS